MQKNLGGDRLGSGAKMNVELHNYERSTHDLGYLFRSTMSAGTLVPFMCEVGLPGDTFDIHLDCNFLTHPTIGPLFGTYKVQLDVFIAPIRLYNAALHNNELGVGMKMNTIYLPQFTLVANPIAPDPVSGSIDNTQINPSCILRYLGLSGIGVTGTEVDVTRDFNAVPLLAYWEIYKNYYANKQEELGAVIHISPSPINISAITVNTSAGGTVLSNDPALPSLVVLDDQTNFVVTYTGGTPPNLDDVTIYFSSGEQFALSQICYVGIDDGVSSITLQYIYGDYGGRTAIAWTPRKDTQEAAPKVVTFDLADIDTMRKKILAAAEATTPLNISGFALNPYVYLFDLQTKNIQNTQEGLAVKTYQSDIFNNWLNTEWIDGTQGITNLTAISTVGNKFTIDQLNLGEKVYNLMNRIAVSGGSFDDYIEAAYGHNKYRRTESPVYMGGLSKELIFQQVVSNATAKATDDTQPLGTLAGRGVLAQKHKGGYVNIQLDEHAYIIGIVSLTPRIDYSQGNRWDTHLQTMADFHVPALDGIGFQELPTEQMAWWDTYFDNADREWITRSAGKQPAWLNYMTNYNRVYGNFAILQNEMFMTLNRRYEPEEQGVYYTIQDLTTYIDPSKFNNIFAQTSLDAMNFWCQIAVDITARRKMSAKVMPNL